MAERRLIYLDNHATTKVDPRVVDAMLPYFSETYGNAASRQHEFGWRAEAAVERGRKQLAALVGSLPEEVIFTSGATESINLALRGLAGPSSGRGKHFITVATEHRAVLDTIRDLEHAGLVSTVLPVDKFGMVDPEDVRRAFRPETVLVSVMAANNEIGTLGPLREIALLCRERGVLLHSDATQAAGRIPLAMNDLDLLSLSAHKIHGPKGAGALVVRGRKPPIALYPQITGGGHERGLRSGTLNVPAIVGFGAAAEIALKEGLPGQPAISQLRDRLVSLLQERIEDVSVNGHPTLRLANNASVTFHNAKADAIMMAMKDIAVSSGSACSSALPEPSHVLQAIGLTRENAASTVRFGLSRFTTGEEIEIAAERVAEAVRGVRTPAFVSV